MSQCYLGSESKTSMTKLYFEVFIANYFYTFNKKDPVYRSGQGSGPSHPYGVRPLGTIYYLWETTKLMSWFWFPE